MTDPYPPRGGWTEVDVGSGCRWVVGTDRDDEYVAEFPNEDEAMRFASFDSQLTDRTAIVARIDPTGTVTVIAEFVR